MAPDRSGPTREFSGGQTWTHNGSREIRGTHAVEFSKTVAPPAKGVSLSPARRARRLCGRTDQNSTIRAPWGRTGAGPPGRAGGEYSAPPSRRLDAGVLRRRRARGGTGAARPARRARRAARPGRRARAERRRRRGARAPWASSRRASEREPPTCSAMKAGRWTVPRRARRPRRSPRAGRPRTKTRAKCAAAAVGRLLAVEALDDARARARAWRRAADAPAGGSSPSSSRYQLSIAVSGMRIVLPYMLLGRVGHADVVAERLRHLPVAVDPRRGSAS